MCGLGRGGGRHSVILAPLPNPSSSCTHSHPLTLYHTSHPHTSQGILDPTLELAKLEKKRVEVTGRIEQLHKKMALPSYADKTPQAVREDDADRLARAEAELTAAQQHMEDMRKMIAEQEMQQ